MSVAVKSIAASRDLDGYEAELATVTATHLGLEDHGINSASISFEGPGWGQGFGHIGLDSPRRVAPRSGCDRPRTERVGTAIGMTHLIRVLEVLGGTWESLRGKRCYVLRKTEDRGNGFIKGIMSLDGGRVYLLDELEADTSRMDWSADA